MSTPVIYSPHQPLRTSRSGRQRTYIAVSILLENVLYPSAITDSTVQEAGGIDSREVVLCSWCNDDAIVEHPTHDRVEFLHPGIFFLWTVVVDGQ